MEYPRRWLAFLVFGLTATNICSQNVPYEGASQIQSKDPKRDLSRIVNSSTKTVTYTNEAPYATNTGDDRPKIFNLLPSQAQYFSQDPISFTNQPANTPNMVTSSTPSASFAPSPARASQNQVISDPISFNTFNNYANAGPAVQTNTQNDAYNYPTNNLVEFANYRSPINLQGGSNSGLDFISGSNFGTISQDPNSSNNGYDEGYPVSLQINVPAQAQTPRITVDSAVPQPVTSVNSERSYSFPTFGFPPPIPIVRKKSQSLRNLLPVLLFALLSDQGNCGGGCCPCGCNCNCNSDSPIPIPYPIPIPTNNPIINTFNSSSSSRKREQRDYEDSDDYQNNNN